MTGSLLQPTTMGGQQLRNRIVLPPLTRGRADDGRVPTDIMQVYYGQRASAGLLISEGTIISAQGAPYPRVPGLYSEAQINGWRRITTDVHDHGSVMYAQLWHVGRQSHSSIQPDGLPPLAPSPIGIEGFTYRSPEGRIPYEVPRQLSEREISGIVADYAQAAANAVSAGFDGVELHAANGYLIDQFLNANSNQRTDKYGGSIENRMRLLHDVVDAMADVLPRNRIGVRFSPSSSWMDMLDPDKKRLYTAAITSLSGTGLGYLHLIEPEIAGSTTVEADESAVPSSYFSNLFDGTVIITGGHDQKSAQQLVDDGYADLVGFGRLFMANPDLPERFHAGSELKEPHPKGFYSGGHQGYSDYPAVSEEALWIDLGERIRAGSVDGEALYERLSALTPAELQQAGEYYIFLQLSALLAEAPMTR